MPSFLPALQSINAELGAISSSAGAASKNLSRLKDDFDAAKSSGELSVEQLAALEEEATQTGDRVAERLREAHTEVNSTGEALLGDLADVQRQAFDALDRLQERVRDARNGWELELREALGAIDAGALRIEDFLVTWGNAVVQTSEGSRTIREILDGLDLGSRQREIQFYIEALREGTVEIEQLLQLLSETGFTVAQQLADMVQAFREGKATLEEIAALVGAINVQFPGSEFGALSDAILDALREGRI